MKESLLKFKPVIENPDLVPSTVYDAVISWPKEDEKKEFLITEIDTNFAGGLELCDKYNIDPMCGANCLIVEGIRGDKKTIAACLVPVGYKYDMNGVVRKAMNARMVSVASLDFVLLQTKMEYGSITPVGLPKDWLIFIDPLVLSNEHVVIGGGFKKSKLSIPSLFLLALPNATILEGLAKQNK